MRANRSLSHPDIRDLMAKRSLHTHPTQVLHGESHVPRSTLGLCFMIYDTENVIDMAAKCRRTSSSQGSKSSNAASLWASSAVPSCQNENCLTILPPLMPQGVAKRTAIPARLHKQVRTKLDSTQPRAFLVNAQCKQILQIMMRRITSATASPSALSYACSSSTVLLPQ